VPVHTPEDADMSNVVITVGSAALMALAITATVMAAVNEIRARRSTRMAVTNSVILAPTSGRNPYSITERDWL
jgi:hypothetical protein